MRIAICDDDRLFSCQLDKCLQEYFKQAHIKCPEIAVFDSGEELLSDMGKKDIVFLDMEMQGLNGICVGKELKDTDKNVIIFVVTAYAEYLDEAMRFNVFRYLSKPLDKNRLFRNMKDALRLYNSFDEKTAVETKKGIFTVNLSDIILVEAKEKKVFVHTISDIFQSIHNMEYWENCLNSRSFYRTHKSFIVNLKYVSSFNRTSVNLYNSPIDVYLARRKYGGFKEAYLLYLEGAR